MNKKEYLASIIKEGRHILQTAQLQGQYTFDCYSNSQVLIISKFDYEKWMIKTNNFLKKYNYTNCQVKVNGQAYYSEIISTKLAMITALYESFDLEDDCISHLNLLPQNVKDLFQDEHFAESAFEAFKYIEVQVRAKSGLTELFGVDLMRKAFSNKSGTLRNNNLPEGEQVAQMELYAGAIGFVKNPKSHKTINVSREKAIELLHTANYLLRVLQEN